MWGILDQLSKSEADEINIDANANWKGNMPKMVVAKEEDGKGILQLYLSLLVTVYCYR